MADEVKSNAGYIGYKGPANSDSSSLIDLAKSWGIEIGRAHV
mgnify:CR=1 FL=1